MGSKASEGDRDFDLLVFLLVRDKIKFIKTQ